MPPPTRRSLLRDPFSAAVALVAGGLGALGARELDWSGVAAAPTALTPCSEAPTTLLWPLGTDGYQPRLLYSSHDQFQKFSADAAVHQGIDIGGCEDEWVYAAAPGTVVHVWGVGTNDSTIVVSDGDDLSRGYMYQHVDDLQFGEGLDVERNDALGKLVAFSGFTGFNHLHFRWVKGCEDPPCDDWEEDLDVANPLPLFPARMDHDLPTVHDLGPAHGVPGPFLFYAHSDKAQASPLVGALSGSVDIVACVTESFPGTASPACPPGVGCSAGFSTDIAPYRLTVCIVLAQPKTSGTQRDPQVVVYRNSIELEGPAPDVVNPDDLPQYYSKDGVGNYTTDRPLFVLTHCADTDGFWNTAANLPSGTTSPVDLQVELVVEDTSGNVRVATMDIAVTLP